MNDFLEHSALLAYEDFKLNNEELDLISKEEFVKMVDKAYRLLTDQIFTVKVPKDNEFHITSYSFYCYFSPTCNDIILTCSLSANNNITLNVCSFSYLTKSNKNVLQKPAFEDFILRQAKERIIENCKAYMNLVRRFK